MKTHDEMIRDLYARRDAYEEQKQLQKRKIKRTSLRLSGIAACLVICLTVGFGMYSETDAPSDPPAESSVIEHSVSEWGSSETESGVTESSDAEQSREESGTSSETSDDEFDDALRYCEILPSNVPMDEEGLEWNENAAAVSNLGSALQAKMRLYADDASYRYNVVVYHDSRAEPEAEELAPLSAKEQAALLHLSIELWTRVEWIEDGEAYYCMLTAEELYALESCGITCLYVGSGKSESLQTDLTLQRVENRIEQYGDRLIGVLPEDESEE